MPTAANQRMESAGTDTRFVQGDEFCRLMTSRRRLERWDDHALGLRGLLDRDSGIRWVIPQQQLQATAIAPAARHDRGN